MSLLKFFKIIDESFIGKFVDKKMDIIIHTDPRRIYVENIRSFYNMPTPAAKLFCELAVKEHIFRRRIGVYCPNCGRLVTSFKSKKDVPQNIVCDTCRLLEDESYEYRIEPKDIKVFYQLVKPHDRA